MIHIIISISINIYVILIR